MFAHLISRRNAIQGLVAAGAFAALSGYPLHAFADPTAGELQAQADAERVKLVSLQADLEEASAQYYAALAELEAANLAIEECTGKIEYATNRITELKGHLGKRVWSMYRTGSTSFVDFLLGASSFEEFVNNWNILERMNEKDNSAVAETKQLKEELVESKQILEESKIIAVQKEAETRQIKEQVAARVEEAQAIVDSLDAEARALLEEEQAAEARRRAEEAAASTPSIGQSVVHREVGSYSGVCDAAMSRIGCPYVWGGAGPDEFDCSGLVQWAYAQVGKYLPHQTEALYACAAAIVPISEARPGDVLYRYGHVGIALSYGGEYYVHAPTPNAYVRDTDSIAWSEFICALQFD